MKKAGKFILGLLIATEAAHVCEWFLEGRHVAKAAGIPVKEALPLCLVKGFLWWKPLKKELKL